MIRFFVGTSLLLWVGLILTVSNLNARANDASIPYAIDPSFHFASTNQSIINDLLVLSDGRIGFASSTHELYAIANEDGSLSETAESPSPSLFTGYSLLQDAENTVIWAGESAYDLVYAGRLFIRESLAGRIKKIITQSATGDLLLVGNMRLKSGADTNSTYGMRRLHRTGFPDDTFKAQDSIGLNFERAAITTQGEIFGWYSHTDQMGVETNALGRWLPDGTRDSNFTASFLQANERVTLLKRGPDGDIYTAIESASPESSTSRIVRLKSSGELRDGYLIDKIRGTVLALAFEVLRSETVLNGNYDRLIVGGQFDRVGDQACNSLATFDQAAEIAWSIPPGQGPNGSIRALELQLDGRILVGGDFSAFSGSPAAGIVRLQGGQTLGRTFVYWKATEFRGFETLGSGELRLARGGNIDAELTLDLRVVGNPSPQPDLQTLPTSVHFHAGETQAVVSVKLADNQLQDGRRRTVFEITTTNAAVVLSRPSTELIVLDDETPGTVDPRFQPSFPYVSACQQQADGKILIASGMNLMRLNSDGSPDPSFTTNGINAKPLGGSFIGQFTVATNGQIYIAGFFNTLSTGAGINHLARLNSDGTLDTTFNPRLQASRNSFFDDFAMVALQPDGRIIVGLTSRNFTSFENDFAGTVRVARLNSNGSIDKSFSSPSAGLGKYRKVLLQPDGKLLISDNATYRIIRFHADGKPDSSFSLAATRSQWIYDFALAGDNLLVAGSFTELNSVPVKYLARVRLSDGAVASEFTTDIDDFVQKVAMQGENIYVGGAFTRVNNRDCFRFARLRNDGAVDTTYDPGVGFWPISPSFFLQSDGGVLAFGYFQRTDGISLGKLVRLEAAPPAGEIPEVVRWSRSNGKLSLEYNGVLEMSEDLVQWDLVPGASSPVDIDPEQYRRFYRVRR